MEYGTPERRKTKGDKKAKWRYGVYKKGGKYRGTKIKEGSRR